MTACLSVPSSPAALSNLPGSSQLLSTSIFFFPTPGIKLARGTHVCARVHMRVHALRVKPGPITPAGRCTVSVPEQNKRKQDTQTMGDKSLTFLGPALCRGVPRGPPCTRGFRVEDSAGVSEPVFRISPVSICIQTQSPRRTRRQKLHSLCEWLFVRLGSRAGKREG